jgi:hypothetical protein
MMSLHDDLGQGGLLPRGPDAVSRVSLSELAGGQGDALALLTQRAAREIGAARRAAADHRDGGVRLWRAA